MKIQFKIFFLNFILILGMLFSFSIASANEQYPFSTNKDNITIWNGKEYQPIFIKGINLGISIPGTYPGELAATYDDYMRWFPLIKEAGYNCIRLYTLHYPRFYEALNDYNTLHPQNPLFIIQGVWLEEELDGFNNDLFNLSDAFRNEISENISSVHGDIVIPPRFGKAFGDYHTDVSQWCIAYIIGREINPYEVMTTNENNISETTYEGEHFSIYDVPATEKWITSMLDYTVSYEEDNYNTERPVAMSSWPTLDPLIHPEETLTDEDVVGVDLSKIIVEDSPAGLFISYHAYPYYPDFVSHQDDYLTFFDDIGTNSYLGYLTELKSHYENFPLIIAEYGVPDSWVIAHYASSGLNHGGFTEEEQGYNDLRLLNTIRTANCGGGIQFSWIDEWFKRTWVSDPLDDDLESRPFWHNLYSAEQNFGLLTYDKDITSANLATYENRDLTSLSAKATTAFFEFEIGLNAPLKIPDEMWIALDTYDANLGESLLPNGEEIPSRSEFYIHLTNYSAQLYVMESYDTFGIWHGISEPEQLYQSIVSDGGNWNIVRVKNNYTYSDIQYIGNLKVNYDFQSPSSTDAVVISEEKITVRLPWNYLNVTSPNIKQVLHDDRSTPEREHIESDGFVVSILYNDEWYSQENRFVWDNWDRRDLEDYQDQERIKNSYYIIKNGLSEFNTKAIAVRDSFYFAGPTFPVTLLAGNGLLANDFDMDGNQLMPFIINQPAHGLVYINDDGGFSYYPDPEFVGLDSLTYAVFDGYSISNSNTAILYVNKNNTSVDQPLSFSLSQNFPNPFKDQTKINFSLSKPSFVSLSIYNIRGQLIYNLINDIQPQGNNSITLSAKDFASGVYFYSLKVNGKTLNKKMVVVK